MRIISLADFPSISINDTIHACKLQYLDYARLFGAVDDSPTSVQLEVHGASVTAIPLVVSIIATSNSRFGPREAI